MAPSLSKIFTTLLALTPLGTFASPLNVWRPTAESGTSLGVFVSNPDATDVVPNSYIVVYHKNTTDDEISAHEASVKMAVRKRNLGKRGLNGQLLSTRVRSFAMSGWRGMALESDDLMMNEINNMAMVNYVEANTYVKAFGLVNQANAPTGLVRLSHAEVGGNGYVFDDAGGENITAYIVDTGIMVTHEDYEGRATMGFNAVEQEEVRLRLAHPPHLLKARDEKGENPPDI